MTGYFQALMETVCPVVVFQYKPKTKGCKNISPDVLNDLNLWVCNSLNII